MVEFHPIANVLDEKTCQAAWQDYFFAEPSSYELPGTYSDRNVAIIHNHGIEWQLALGDIVSALPKAGLRIDFLRERPITTFNYFNEALVFHEAGYWTYPDGVPRLPLSYSLRATR
jgi:hypothetical protein